MILFHKQPSEVLDYDVDLSDFLPAADTIVSATPSVDVAGLTFGDTTIDNVNKIVKQWISAGVDASTYVVTMLITSAQGRTKEVEFKLKVKEI